LYSAIVSEHFHNPRRVGPLAEATHTGTAGVVGEGPYMVLWLRIAGERVEAAAYRTFGCPAAVACASMVCELTENQAVEAAARLAEPDLVAALEGLPEGKEHCPRLAIAALRAALIAAK
jgi:nitrogen fixation NifU-like protein